MALYLEACLQEAGDDAVFAALGMRARTRIQRLSSRSADRAAAPRRQGAHSPDAAHKRILMPTEACRRRSWSWLSAASMPTNNCICRLRASPAPSCTLP